MLSLDVYLPGEVAPMLRKVAQVYDLEASECGPIWASISEVLRKAADEVDNTLKQYKVA